MDDDGRAAGPEAPGEGGEALAAVATRLVGRPRNRPKPTGSTRAGDRPLPVEEAYLEAIDGLSDRELEEELVRQGFVPEEVEANAGSLRERLRKISRGDREVDSLAGEPAAGPRDRRPGPVERLCAIVALARHPEGPEVQELLEIAKDDEILAEEIHLLLGRRGVPEARLPLLDLVRTTQSPWTAARAAEALVVGFGDASGLVAFQGDLGVVDERIFRRAWHLFRAVAPQNRNAAFLAKVGQGLSRQAKAEHVAALLELLRGGKPSEAVGELVVPWLQDARRVRARLLGRRGRLGDLAAERLLEALGVEKGRGLAARLRFRRCRRRLRRELQTVEDWRRLLEGGRAQELTG